MPADTLDNAHSVSFFIMSLLALRRQETMAGTPPAVTTASVMSALPLHRLPSVRSAGVHMLESDSTQLTSCESKKQK